MKTLPIGKSDFKEIIEYNSYYLDKTLLIEELLKDKTSKIWKNIEYVNVKIFF